MCVRVCVFPADVPTVDGPLSSIKKMSALINHDAAHPPGHMSLPAAVCVQRCSGSVLVPSHKKKTADRKDFSLLSPAVSSQEGGSGGGGCTPHVWEESWERAVGSCLFWR